MIMRGKTVGVYRLHKLIAKDWGTFSGWTEARFEGKDTVVSGQSGSGKSTLVADGIQTVFHPRRELKFNVASGDLRTARSIESYFLGQYAQDGNWNPVYVRPDGDHVTVVMAQFAHTYPENEPNITMGVVFYRTSVGSDVRALYFVAEKFLEPSLFEGFGSDISGLKKILKQAGGNKIELFDADRFKSYRLRCNELLGDTNEAIHARQNLIGMKDVTDLSAQIKALAIIPPEQNNARGASIDEQCEEFAQAYEAQQAGIDKICHDRDVLEALKIPIAHYRGYNALVPEYRNTKTQLRHVRYWIAGESEKTYNARLKIYEEKAIANGDQIREAKARIAELNTVIKRIKEAIEKSGGARVLELDDIIAGKRETLSARVAKRKEFISLLDTAGLESNALDTPDNFRGLGAMAASRSNDAAQQYSSCIESIGGSKAELARKSEERESLSQTIADMKSMDTRITGKIAGIRRSIMEQYGLSRMDVPFLGELVKVRDGDEHHAWNAALERLLHDMAAAIILPESIYDQVIKWADSSNHGIKVHFLSPSRSVFNPMLGAIANSVLQHLDYRKDSPYAQFVKDFITANYNLQCTSNIDEMMNNGRDSITQSGLFRRNRVLFAKDDTFAPDDLEYSRLGWVNDDKLSVMVKKLNELDGNIRSSKDKIRELEKNAKSLRSQIDNWNKIMTLCDLGFERIDADTIRKELVRCEKERETIMSGGIKELKNDLEKYTIEKTTHERNLEVLFADQGAITRDTNDFTQKLENTRKKLSEELAMLGDRPDQAVLAKLSGHAKVLAKELGAFNTDTITEYQNHIEDDIRNRILDIEKKMGMEEKAFNDSINDLTGKYPEYSAEIQGVQIEFADKLEKIALRLEKNTSEESIKKLKGDLHIACTRNIAVLNATLNSYCNNVKDQIRKICATLRKFDMNGTYLAINARDTRDIDIIRFSNSLKAIQARMLNGSQDEIISETGDFIRQLTCRGQEYATEEHRRKIARIKDVRNWFDFGLEEYSTSDDLLLETFDSRLSGKSGGQRERLSGAVLVVSVASQLRLTGNEQPAKTLRFCIIDEAFFKGSDEPVKYSIELFKKLGLQLIIVTPHTRPWFVRDFTNYLYFYSPDRGKHCWQTQIDVSKTSLDREISRAKSIRMDNYQ